MLRRMVQRFHAERLPFGDLAGILSIEADAQAGEVQDTYMRTKAAYVEPCCIFP